MKISISDIRDNLADALNRVAYGGERIVLTRRGRGVAAIVSMDELRFLEEWEDRSDIEAARKALAEKGDMIPLEQVLKRYGMKPRSSRRKRSKAG